MTRPSRTTGANGGTEHRPRLVARGNSPNGNTVRFDVFKFDRGTTKQESFGGPGAVDGMRIRSPQGVFWSTQARCGSALITTGVFE